MNRIANIEINANDYKILIVDDVISNTLLLRAQLKNENYQIVTATNGIEAIEIVEKEFPDLILLDVMMPGLNGFEVSQHLKASQEYRDIPIIFLTALNSTGDIVKGFQLGANDFITKPFNKDELIIRVRHQISLIAAKRLILKQTEELRNTIFGRDKLYSVIAHDLRGPLGSIKMVLNLLITNLPNAMIGQDMFDMLNLANRTTEDVFALLDNLLKWTKSQIGNLKVVHQKTDAISIVSDALDIFNMSAELKSVTLKYEGPKEAMIYADIDMVKTILRNLLSNAIKYTSAGGTIVISIEEKDNFLNVSVKDNGRGIKKEDQEKLFHTDTHFSTFGTNNEEGSGLGLLLCKDFALKNGGDLWFTSEEGKGSIFSFSIPRNKTE